MPSTLTNHDFLPLKEPMFLTVPLERMKAEEFIRFLGTGGVRTKAWDAIVEAGSSLQERLTAELAANACFSVVPVNEAGNREVNLAGFSLPSDVRFFHGANGAAVVVVTMGEKLDEIERSFFHSGDYLDALVLNALAAACLERGLRTVREELRKTLPEGVLLGYNLSPGCQQIPLEAQKNILDLCLSERIGVQLNEGFMMKPAKSTSNIIPLGQELKHHSEAGAACDICAKGSHCPYRHR